MVTRVDGHPITATSTTRERTALAPVRTDAHDPENLPQHVVLEASAQNTRDHAEAVSKLLALGERVVTPAEQSRLKAAKRSYATRRIELGHGATLISGAVRPAAGDLVLARVDTLGHHRKLESPAGRRAELYLGDEILLLYGNRYATDQFEAVVPDNLEPCHMVAGGGIAAQAILSHSKARTPTVVVPLGLVGDSDGKPLNLQTYAQNAPRLALDGAQNIDKNKRGAAAKRGTRVIAVVGTSMNAGKTTLAAKLIKGLARAGYRVGAGKVTGTGAGGDRWSVLDAGASQVIDFTDFGHPSTYLLSGPVLARLFGDICDALCDARNDYVVLEIADGLFFPETADLVQAEAFRQRVDDVMLAASDAMGAAAGVRFLEEKNLGVCAIGGKVTASPLAIREARRSIGIPLVSSHELETADWAFPAAPEKLSNRA